MNKKKNILVIDDNHNNLLLMCRMLEDEGYNTFSANSGELALASLEDNIPDIILLDILMPEMDGFEVCKQIKQIEKLVEIPIIFLTAANKIADKLNGFKLGAVDYISKPFEKEELLARIKTHLALRESQIVLIKTNKELILAKEKTVESEERFRTLFTNSHAVMLLINPKSGNILDANKAAEKYYGYTHTQFIDELFIHNLNTLTQKEIKEEMDLALKGEKGYFSFKHKLANGKVRDVEVYSGKVAFNNNEVLFSIIHDITDRKETQRKLKRSEDLLETTQSISKVGGWEYDVEKDKMYWTKQTYAIHDMAPEEFKYGSRDHIKRGLLCYDEKDRPIIIKAFENCSNNGQAYDLEFPFTTVKGRRIWIRTAAKAIKSKGKIVMVSGNIMDISIQKNIEIDLKASIEINRQQTKYLNKLNNNLADALLNVKFPECTIEYVNDSIYKILNYSPEECFGKKASILFPSEIEYNEYYKRLTEGIDRNEENIHIEQVLKKKDGELITTEINTTFLKEKNKVVRVISTIRDITLQKQANEKIKRFSRIFEDSLNEIYLFEADTLKFTQANRAAIHNLGYTMEELRELTPIHVKPEFTEESFEKLITPLRSGEKEKIVIETVHQRKDQSLYNSEVHLQLLKFENESIFAAIILDITERKHTEQVLRDSQEAWKTTFNAMTDWISLIDPKTRLIINANTACKKYTGLPINKVIGSKCYKAFNNSDKPHANCPLERLLKSNKREEKEIQIGENGKWFLISTDPVFDKNKEIVSVVHSVRDITDRKLSENKITHLNLVLQAISKVNHLIIEEKKSDILIKRTCKILTENRGYENAWIVLFNEKGEYLYSAESGLGKGFSPIQNILKNGKWPYCGNLALKKKDISIIDEPHKVCKDCPLSSNYVNNSSYTISLRHGDTIYGFLTVSIPKFLINDKEEQSLFKEIGGDISFALHNIEIETKREKSDKDLLEANKIINRGSAVAFLWKNEKSWPVEIVSDNVKKLTGYSSREFIDRKILYRDIIHIDDIEQVSNEVNESNIGKIRNYFNHQPYRIITKKGDVKWVDDRTYIRRDENGEITHYEGIVSDISKSKEMGEALQESEVKFRSIIEHSNDAIYLLFNNKFELINNKFIQMFEYNLKDVNMPDFNFSQLISPKSLFVVEDRRKKLTKGEKLSSKYEFTALTKRGKEIEVEVSVSYINYKDGKATQGIIRDITERNRTNKELANHKVRLEELVKERTLELSYANSELAKAARMKDEFLASMSHELRTPLNAVLGLSEALQEEIYGKLNLKQLNTINNIEESGRHLLDLINEILDLAKIEAGKVVLDYQQISIEKLMQSCLRFIKQTALKKQIKVSTKISSTVDAFRADEKRMKQILVNLLSNAVKFTPDGGKVGFEVKVNVKNRTINFEVWDTGIGIEPENFDKLFKPFIQIDSKLSREYAGTGLGLALVNNLTELHNGSILFDSKPGKGSQFNIIIPLREYPGKDFESIQYKDKSKNDKVDKVLIIEDSSIAADQLNRYLEKMNIKSITHTHGYGAVEMAEQVKPDLIILDILLPDITGWDVLEQLKKNDKTNRIPVIICSVLDEKEKGLELGASGYLVKPTSRKKLIKTISKISNLRITKSEVLIVKLDEKKSDDSKRLILLAEDNEQSIITIKDYLDANQFNVVVVRNGEEAVKITHELKPDLILMDIQMPVMDGLAAITEIRASSNPEISGISIIALTALAMPGDKEKCIKAGANQYLAKPIGLKNLVITINECLEKKDKRTGIK